MCAWVCGGARLEERLSVPLLVAGKLLRNIFVYHQVERVGLWLGVESRWMRLSKLREGKRRRMSAWQTAYVKQNSNSTGISMINEEQVGDFSTQGRRVTTGYRGDTAEIKRKMSIRLWLDKEHFRESNLHRIKYVCFLYHV
ncbi:hypothetical protein RRG08_031203 [Elysia crispata]|uniref:Uncharacterized protein n=1 Tax=Elysia crispata TaxID=231223 RepID=A0AAE1CIY9_9GAST|nr:hypothetical protein RRG08_031203 [Elysia crispata]